MKLRLMLLLSAVATGAVGMAPATAAAVNVTFAVKGVPLAKGTTILGTSTNTLMTSEAGTAECPIIKFTGTLKNNKANPVLLQQVGDLEFPYEGWDPKFEEWDCSHISQPPWYMQVENFQVGKEGLVEFFTNGTVNFDSEFTYHWAPWEPRNFAGPCQAEGNGGATWSSGSIGYNQGLITTTECFHITAMQGELDLTDASGNPVEILVK